MFAITEIKNVQRAERKAGKVVVKGVDMVHVAAVDGSEIHGLNLHKCGKVEYFINAQYAMVGSVAYNAMLKAAKEFA